MQIERTEDGWIVRVPDAVVEALGLADGARVTLRPVSQQEDDLRHYMAQMRGRLPDFPFDEEDWDGVDVMPGHEVTYGADFEWSTKPVPSSPTR